MKTKALRLYGVNDLRLEEFELPQIQDDEILVEVISDSVCMSTYKAASLGANHKRVPDNVAENPTIVGHEYAGNIVQVGKNHQDKFKPGMKFAIQPALNYKGTLWSPGYSYPYCGGDMTYSIMPAEVMECGCLLDYHGDAYYKASLAEPMSCLIGGAHANYHTRPGVYTHDMGIVEGGKVALLAGAGPMGLGLIAYLLNCDRRPSLFVVTDIDDARLARAEHLFPVEEAAKKGITLRYVNTGKCEDPVGELKNIAGGDGYNDVFVFAPVRQVVEQGDAILGRDGCLNFFAGPTDSKFSAMFNFYEVHYGSHHVVGTSGGNLDDMRECLDMTAAHQLDPSVMITHVGGMNAARETILNLPKIPGGKKLIYTHIDMPLTAISDFAKAAETDPRFGDLDAICKAHKGLWCTEAEEYVLKHW